VVIIFKDQSTNKTGVRWWRSTRPIQITSKDELLTSSGISEIRIRTSLIPEIFKNLNPSSLVEEGGILIGFLEKNETSSDSEGERWKVSQSRLIVADQILSGPAARKTAGSLHSDLDFQASVFRKIESKEMNIQHLGSWHSHHCNGYQVLSNGDLESYSDMVNSPRHAHKYYFAILVTGIPKGKGRFTRSKPELREYLEFVKFYLLVRGQARFYSISNECLTFIDDIPNFSKMIQSLSKEAYRTSSSILDNPTDTEIQKEKFIPSINTGLWYDRDEAKQILKDDEMFLSNFIINNPLLEGKIKVTIDNQIERIISTKGIEFVYRYPKLSSEEGIFIKAERTNMLKDDIKINRKLVQTNVYRIQFAKFIFQDIIETILASSIYTDNS